MKGKKVEKIKKIIQGKWWYEQHAGEESEGILSIIANLCSTLPSKYQSCFINVVDKTGLILSRLLNLLNLFIYPTFVIQIKEKKSRQILTILYQGNKDSIRFLLKYINTDENTIQIRKVKSYQKQSNSIIDLIIIKSDFFYRGFFQRNKYLVFPEYISMILDTSKSSHEIISQVSSKITNDLSRAKTMGYTFEITDDYDKFLQFYQEMYVPYATWKHKSTKRIATFETIRHLMLQGAKILFLKQKNEYIFGGMFIIKGKKVETYYAGLSKGKFNHLKYGVMALSYVHLITIAREHKCELIDFGTARAFLNDGLFRYKEKWGMMIQQTSPFVSDLFSLKIKRKTNAVEKFFSQNSFIYYKDQKFAVAFISTRKQGIDKTKSNRRILKNMQSSFFTVDEVINGLKEQQR